LHTIERTANPARRSAATNRGRLKFWRPTGAAHFNGYGRRGKRAIDHQKQLISESLAVSPPSHPIEKKAKAPRDLRINVELKIWCVYQTAAAPTNEQQTVNLKTFCPLFSTEASHTLAYQQSCAGSAGSMYAVSFDPRKKKRKQAATSSHINAKTASAIERGTRHRQFHRRGKQSSRPKEWSHGSVRRPAPGR